MGQMIGSIIGGVIQIGGGVLGAEAEHDQYLDTAKYYSEAASDERVAAADREQVRREQIRRQLGQQVTSIAKSNVAFTGSPMLALAESLRLGEEDMLALRRENSQRITDLERMKQQNIDAAEHLRNTGGFARIAGGAAAATNNIIRSSNQPSVNTTQRSGWTTNGGASTTPWGQTIYGTSEGE